MLSRQQWLLGAWAGCLVVVASPGCTLQPYTQYGTSGVVGETTGTTGEATGTSGAASVDATGSATGSATGMATTTGSMTTTTAGTSGSESTMMGTPDLPPAAEDCDGWMMPNQDCPAGQKCTFDGVVSETHCVDVVDDPKDMYEPCQILMGSSLSGYDDCGPGLVCWNVDPDTGFGECVGVCLGPIDGPSCVDPLVECSVICEQCALGLCLPMCDPLAQDCPNEALCIPNPKSPGEFVCVLDASGEEGQVFDTCEFANMCDPGLVCLDPGGAVECDELAIGCCLPLCDTNMPVCPGAGQECLAWYEVGMAPPGFENVGVCGLFP